MQKKYCIGNWKSHKTLEECRDFFEKFNFEPSGSLAVGFALPFPYLGEKRGACQIYAQNVSAFEQGAYTGEVAASMMKSLGITGSLVGHSERRLYFQESGDILGSKLERLQEQGLSAIFCFGESEEDADHYEPVLRQQLLDVASAIEKFKGEKIILAYEPVWAIGTGKTATPERVGETHQFVQQVAQELWESCPPLLYGGSVKAANVFELAVIDGVDGFLVGGASLDPAGFQTLCQKLL